MHPLRRRQIELGQAGEHLLIAIGDGLGHGREGNMPVRQKRTWRWANCFLGLLAAIRKGPLSALNPMSAFDP
jgi:hypothetical protein